MGIKTNEAKRTLIAMRTLLLEQYRYKLSNITFQCYEEFNLGTKTRLTIQNTFAMKTLY